MLVNISPGIDIDAQQIMTGRCCILGQSGSGKSYLVGVIAEELCRLGLPFIIVDTEGEYSSLKSAFGAIWVGNDEKADLRIDEVDYGQLIENSIRNSVPIVFDLSDVTEKVAQVSKALGALYNLEEGLRSPYLVIIEEADKFAPQVIHKGTNMVEEISVRGRKRGIGLIVATQRPASISKNVLAQCSYGFIGRLTIENDIAAINVLLDSRRMREEIVRLETGHFVPFGMKFSHSFAVKGRSVVHRGGTPPLHEGLGKKADISAIVSGLRSQATDEPEQRKKAGKPTRHTKIFAIKAEHTAEEARRLAERLASGRLGGRLGGRMNVESVEPVYVPLLHAQVLAPTKKSSVFKEFYVVADGRGRLVRYSDSLHFIEPGADVGAAIGEKEAAVAEALRSAGKADYDRLESMTRMRSETLVKTIDRLSKIGVLRDDGRKYSIVDMIHYASPKPAETDELLVSDAELAGQIDQKRVAKMLKVEFLGCRITPLAVVHLPMYRIVLRKGNTVRILMYDAVHMDDQSARVAEGGERQLNKP